ncbi:hypothetical protein [Clostridium akagii]|uniref:hypothetical protein n=1 Tax=Clostridium akagii TaxID=91623 RepID=UPI00047C6987|nr:hypothetical protein [Clostridium akagii]
MVQVVMMGDATMHRLSEKELKDIAEYICNKDKLIERVKIYYREENGNVITNEKVLEYDCTPNTIIETN